MTCPMNCPKNLRNGPCGGVRLNGKCEVKPEMDCVWVKGYERAQKTPYAHEFYRLNPPVDWRLEGPGVLGHLRHGARPDHRPAPRTIRYATEAVRTGRKRRPRLEGGQMNGVIPTPVPPAAARQDRLDRREQLIWRRCCAAGHFAVCVEVSPPVGPNPEAVQSEIKTAQGLRRRLQRDR